MALDIDQIAQLACLRLKPAEKERLRRDLDAILAYVKLLEKVNTDHVEGLSHVLNAQNVMRADVAGAAHVRDDMLKHAPERAGNFLKVPRVVDKD